MWGFTHKTYVQNNFLLQRKIVRVMTFASKTDHSDPIFANLEFLKIDGIRQLQLLSFVYDCQNKLAQVRFHDYFVPCSPVHRFNTKLASRGAKLWNMLPVNLRESSSAPVFYAELKNTCYHLTIPHHNGTGSQALPCTICSCSTLLGTMSTCQILLYFLSPVACLV